MLVVAWYKHKRKKKGVANLKMLARVFHMVLPTSPQAFHDFQTIGRQVQDALKSKPTAEIEFEVRFGNIVDSAFDSGVPQDFFNRVRGLLVDSMHWSVKAPLSEHEDAFYNTTHGAVRTRSEIVNGRAHLTHICKQSMGKWTYNVKSDHCHSATLAVRLALNHEIPVTPPDGHVETTHYVIAHREVYEYTPSGYEQPMLALELKQIWCGKNRTRAEQLQRTVPGKFTIEIEVTDPALFNHKLGPGYTVLTSVVKLLDFVRYQEQTPLPFNAVALQNKS